MTSTTMMIVTTTVTGRPAPTGSATDERAAHP